MSGNPWGIRQIGTFGQLGDGASVGELNSDPVHQAGGDGDAAGVDAFGQPVAPDPQGSSDLGGAASPPD